MSILEGKTVLVVDDLSMIRKVLANYLSVMGINVIQAADAESALELMYDQQIDAFLLDIELPSMDGIELCRRLRRMQRYQHTPVLFITALDQERVLKACFEAGGDDMLVKPVSETVLAVRLKNHLERMAYAQQIDLMQRKLNSYVCPRTQEVAQQQVVTGRLPSAEKRDVSVLFTDVRGFTQLSQEIEAEELFSVLSDHLGAQARCVYRFNGYVDKFSGDGVMAVFDGPDRHINSCLCALKIIEYAKEHINDSSAPLYQLGIGIHAGTAMIGNIGSERHLDYTVIGPTVNLAARLCGQAEALSVTVSEVMMVALADDPQVEFVEPQALRVKGVKEPVVAYQLKAGIRPGIVVSDDDVDAMPI